MGRQALSALAAVTIAASVATAQASAGQSRLLTLVAAQNTSFMTSYTKIYEALPNLAKAKDQSRQTMENLIAADGQMEQIAAAAIVRFSGYQPQGAKEQQAKPVVLEWLRDTKAAYAASAAWQRAALSDSPTQYQAGQAAEAASGKAARALSRIAKILAG